MAKYNVHGGHNSIVPGANMYLNEVTEDRNVKDKVIAYLRAAGHTAYDCTDDSGTTQSRNLSNIVAKCNAHSVDLDISIHLNAGGGTGTEVLYYPGSAEGQAMATKVSAKIASAFGWKDRGAKARSDLYVLKNTKAVAILVECCFVDSQADAAAWSADKCAKAIVEAVTGSAAQSTGSSDTGSVSTAPSAPATSAPASTSKPTINFKYRVKAGGKWYPEVVNLNDYAGVRGKSITDIAIGVDRGSVWYQVHVKGGKWLPKVTGYNINDYNNGYAGNGNVIDAVRVYYNTPADYANKYGYQKAQYRVSPVNANYYAWQYDDDDEGVGQDGYAGAFGKAIDRFQLF